MVSQFQLKNGLKVILIESHKAPVVSLQAWVRTGSADESPREAGLSHFIEHLLFKSTRKFSVGEIAQTVEGSGGELNAYTSFDQTVFYMTLSNHFLETGLEALSDMVGFPRFDPEEIDAEREVVIEEMRRGQDSVGRQASQLLFQTAYPGHPYGRPVIGYEKIIRAVSPKAIEKYFRERYVPKNMFLLVSGSFPPDTIKGQVRKYFEELPANRLRPVKRPKLKKPTRPRIKVASGNFEQSLGYLAWPIPPITHKDIPGLDLLSFVLGGGDSSRLVRRLRLQQALVESTGASTFTPSEAGLFLVSVNYRETPLEKILEVVEEEILRLIREPATEEEIRRSVTLLSTDELFSLETVDGLARKFGHLEFHFRNLKVTEKYLRALRTLTAVDLMKLARKYLDPKALTISILSRRDSQSQDRAVKDFVRSYGQNFKKARPSRVKAKKIKTPAIPKIKFQRTEPRTELVELPSGDRILFRPSTETAMVSVRAATLAGIRLEPAGESGLSELTQRSWLGGTKSYDENQLAGEVENIAASLSPLSGRNSLSLGLDVLSQFETKGAELFFETLEHATFPEEIFDRERIILLRQQESRKDNPTQIAMQLFLRNLFAGHPYAKDVQGDPEEIRRLTAERLRQWWKEIYLERRKHFVVCGAFDRDLWLREIKNFAERLKAGPKDHRKFAVQHPENEIVVFEKAEKEQSHLIIGHPGVSLTDEDRYALQVIQSVLAGQGGRLFIELRDKQSLAYSVAPLRMEGIESGYFGAYIGCAPDKVEQALKMLKHEFQRLAEETVPERELDRARRYLIGRQDIDLQRTSAISAALLFSDLYGIDFEEPFQASEKFQAVTAEDLRRVAGKIVSRPAVVALVGPREFK